jgi:hypothetical protein
MKSTETPAGLLRISMRESAKLALRARGILEMRLGQIEKAMKDPVIIGQDQGALAADAIEILAALDKTIESSGKLLMTRASPVGAEDTPSTAEDIMNEIKKGKKL